MTRVMIVDDEAPFRFLLKALAGKVGGLEVVAEVDSAEEALEKAAGTQPDLVLMDVRLPGMSGLQGASRMRETCPGARIILMSADDRPGYRALAVNWGAAAFLPKRNITPATLREAALV